MIKKVQFEKVTNISPILIVDDNETLSEILAESLEYFGIKSITFSNPLDVVNYVQDNKENIHIIVTDYHMPKLTGLEMIRKVHKKISTPYVLMSGQLSKITDSYNINEIARLQKPFKTDELLQLISDYLHDSVKQPMEL